MNEQITKLMKNLGITEEEAKAVLEADKQIDKGEKLFELSAEQEKASKKARQADRKKETAPKQQEKKTDAEKQKIISVLAEIMTATFEAEELNITNPEREFLFTIDGRKFKIVLSCPRS